jgi:hypothetical protein
VTVADLILVAVIFSLVVNERPAVIRPFCGALLTNTGGDASHQRRSLYLLLQNSDQRVEACQLVSGFR